MTDFVPGVIFTEDADPAVVAHWTASYAGIVAGAGLGGPTALAVTLRRAQREVALARMHGTEPELGVG